MASNSPFRALLLASLCGLLALLGNTGASWSASTLPAPAAADPDHWQSGGPYGGPVQALALSPTFGTDGFALAGGWQSGPYGVSGGYGIARTTDSGATWTLLQDQNHRYEVFDLALSHAFAADRSAFAGTGQGLLRTTDRGETWLRLYGGLPDSTAHDPAGIDDIAQVLLSPTYGTDRLVLARQRDGALYRSTDGGDTWSRRLSGGVVLAAAFSHNFAANQTAFAAQFDGRFSSNLMRSTDGGQSWALAYTQADQRVADILETADGALLLATGAGVIRLTPDGAGGYAEAAVSPQLPGPAYRLARAGDNIYAASFDGLYISLSFGRGWSRVPGAPVTPYQVVAPCPQWGSCHAVMAGARQGIVATSDDNRAPWTWLDGPAPVTTKSVAVSPAYVADGTLFAGSEMGVYRSTNRGASWQRMTPADAPTYPYAYPAVRISPAYAADGTVFATVADLARPRATLYKSTDRGVTWAMLPAVTETGFLALSPAYGADQTLFLAQSDVLRKSTDGGATWRNTAVAPPEDGFFVFELAPSPAYATDRTLFATGFGRARRSTDGGGTWADMSTYGPSYGLAVSPDYAADGTLWHTYRAIEGPGDDTPESGVLRSTDRGAIWSFATGGLPGHYEPFALPIAASPRYAADRVLFTALSGQFVSGDQHSLYRAIDGGNHWMDLGPAPGNPNVYDLEVAAPATGGLDAYLATAQGVWRYEDLCEERLANGGFEGNAAWEMPTTPATASYSTLHTHSGLRSMRTGIDGMPDVYSYSSGSQVVTIPGAATRATLSFWWYAKSAEGPITTAAGPDRELLRGLAVGQLSAGLAVDDRQYVLVLDMAGNILDIVFWTRTDARTWQRNTFDLSAYRGRTVRIAFGTLNDGDGLSTAMYVDDVSLTACWPAPPAPSPTPSVTPSATVTRTPGLPGPRAWIPMFFTGRYFIDVTATPTATPTATRSATPTATPSFSPTPTATATICPMPTPELLAVEPLISPTNLLTQTVIVRIGHGTQVVVSGESGVYTTTGSFDAYGNPARLTINLLPDTVHHLTVAARVQPAPLGGCVFQPYTLTTTADRNGVPLTILHLVNWPNQTPTPTQTRPGTPSITPSATPTRTSTPSATASPTGTATPSSTPSPTPTAAACTEGITNGGFETDTGWVIRPNPVLAAYVTAPTHSGARSMRTGIASGGANVEESYSPVEQAVTFGGVASAQLTFWRSNFYDDGMVNASEPGGGMAGAGMVLPATEAALAAATFPTDFFYVIAIHDDKTIDWLWREAVNWPEWRALTLDVSRYAREHIRFQFGTYNNGTIGASRTYVDDITLHICPPAGSLMRRVFGQPAMNTIYADIGGRLYRSDDAGGTWQASGVALPEHTILSADANTLYAGDGYPCYKGGDPTPLWRTTNGGQTWSQQLNGVNLKPLAAHASLAWLYAAGCNGPYLSGDWAQSFWHQPDPLFSVYDVHSIAPVGAWWTEIWVGGISEGGGGAVLVSRDAGASWQQSTPLYLDMGWLGALLADRTQPERVYAAAYYGFFYTPDNGATWINNSQGLADVIGDGHPAGLFALAQEPGPPGSPGARLLLGTKRGLYVRDPATQVWTKATGQPFDGLQIDDLLILDSVPYRLYVTTPDEVFLYDLRSLPPMPTPAATATATVTPSRTPTPTITATPGGFTPPTAAPGVWPTPYRLALLSLPARSHPHGIALSPAGDVAYVAFHGREHDGSALGIVSTAPLSLTGQVALGPTGMGPNGVALAGARVAVANRQTANVALVEPFTRTVAGWLASGNMPDGVIAAGRFGYVANFGTDTVTVFDTATYAVLSTLSVGHEPSLFAADPTTGDVYLSLHGAPGGQVLRLQEGAVAAWYNDIPAPYGLAFDPASRRLYVANRGTAHTVTVIDTATGAQVGAIGVGREPFVLAVNPDSGHLFVACGDEVQVYRTLDWRLVTRIAVPPGAEEGMALDGLRDWVYVTSGDGDALTVIQDAAPPLVLFSSTRAGQSEIYRMLPDGRDVQRLTTTAPAQASHPAGSPDGRWIAYARSETDGTAHLWLMSRDGRATRQLTFGDVSDGGPTWSPDGTHLAFHSVRAGNWDIYTLRLSDGFVRQLTDDPGSDLNPDWSWSNGRIAFQSAFNTSNGEIFSMAGDGGDMRRLIFNPNGDAAPSWAPDGPRLAFWGTRGEQTLYVLQADGMTAMPIVPRDLRPGGPAWGPAAVGNSIVFSGYRPGSGYSELFRVAPDGSGLALLTFNEVDWDSGPGWLVGP